MRKGLIWALDLALGWSMPQVIALLVLCAVVSLGGCSVFTDQVYFRVAQSPYAEADILAAAKYVKSESFLDYEALQDACARTPKDILQAIYKLREGKDANEGWSRLDLLERLNMTALACSTGFERDGVTIYYDSRLTGYFLEQARRHELSHAHESYDLGFSVADMARHDHYR